MERYLMYLRKSRMDTDYENVSVAESLSRHRTILENFCKAKKRNTALSREIKNLQKAEADLLRKKEAGAEADQAAMDIIPTAQHILDNYDILTTEEKNRLWKLVLKKATLYRTPAGELSVHIYPKLPK